MSPRLEEAQRLLRLARRDQAAFTALAAAPAVALAVACFHAQQAAEKSLKSVLCLHGVGYRRTHDLEELAGALADIGLPVPATVDALRRLTPYAVEFRYDDEAPQLLTAGQAAAIVDALLAWAAARTEEPQPPEA